MSQVTGLVLTLNGQRYLKKCLQSLDFCDELLVIDSESSDDTCKIAEQMGARVLVNPWPGPVAQFEFAFQHIKTDWVISLDQDEYLSSELKNNIQQALQDTANCTGFYCPRTSYYFNRFLRHSGWYPDYLLRVFRLSSSGVHASGPHYGIHTKGNTKRMQGDIIHHPYLNLSEHFQKIDYYTQQAAQEMFNQGKKSSLTKSLGHGLARFFKLYFLKAGFLDGKAGLVLALNSFFYAFHKYIRLLELEYNSKNETNSR